MIPPALTDARVEALARAEGQEPTPKAIALLAATVGADDARWAFTQWALRRAARSKFAKAADMLFTREALEQATHEAVAAFRASRFPLGEAVADLTCSIGGDLIALAARGAAIGYDVDPERLAYARHNLAAYGLEAELRLEDVVTADWDFAYAIADPARRAGGRRLRSLSEFSPDPLALAARMKSLNLGCMKLSPMLADDQLDSLQGAVEFWSFGGECREAALWWGTPTGEPIRAVRIESGAFLMGGVDPPTASKLGPFLFEADPAAIRAHALGSFEGLTSFGDVPGYLTGEDRPASEWLTPYHVVELVHHERDLAPAIRRLEGHVVAVKSRVPAFDANALHRRLRRKASGSPLTVLVATTARKLRYVIARRRS